MASRNTKAEAQKCQTELQKLFPNSSIVVIEKSRGTQSRYLILEKVNCYKCGESINTAAIGEDGNDRCSKCVAESYDRLRQQREVDNKASKTRIARLVAMDEWEE